MWFSNDFDCFYFNDDAASRKTISFGEFSKNKNNFEYLKEFNRLNDYQPCVNIYNSKTKDIIQVNKGFIYNLFDDEDEDQANDSGKFEFLAD